LQERFCLCGVAASVDDSSRRIAVVNVRQTNLNRQQHASSKVLRIKLCRKQQELLVLLLFFCVWAVIGR
jgi:hypothetical protein